MSTNSLRGNPRGRDDIRFSEFISLRQDILGFSDEFKNKKQTVDQVRRTNLELFRKWVHSHTRRDEDGWTDLEFEFATEIDSPRMFAINEWNQKIFRIGVGFRGSDLGVTQPMVELTQGGTASYRRFPPFPPPGVIERMSLSGLGTKELEDVQKRPAEQRTYVKVSALLNPSKTEFEADREHKMKDGLQELSVAADRWTFHLDRKSDPANKSFPIHEVSDIVFLVQYTFNHPAEIVGTALGAYQTELARISRQ